jgi:hypothetical protein
MHAILTLHAKIRSGELTQRREASGGAGAGIEISQVDGQTDTGAVRLLQPTAKD